MSANRRSYVPTIEECEQRLMPDTKGLVIPAPLLDAPIVQQWNQEHASLDHAVSQMTTIHADLVHFTLELTNDTQRADGAGQQLAALAPQLTTAIADHVRLGQELQNLQTTMQDLNGNLETHRQAVTQLTKDIQALQTTLNTLKQELAVIEQTPVTGNSNTLTSLQKQKTAKERERTALQTQHRIIATNRSLPAAVKNRMLYSTNLKITAASRIIDNLTVKISALQGKLLAVGSKNGEILATQASIDSKTAALSVEYVAVDTLSAQIATYPPKIADAEKAFADAGILVTTLTTEHDRLAEIRNGAVAEIADDQTILTARRGELAATESTIQAGALRMAALDDAVTHFVETYELQLRGSVQSVLEETPAPVPETVIEENPAPQTGAQPPAPTAAAEALPTYAPIRESFVPVRSSVEISSNFDWLELRTKNFDGIQRFALGSTVITPQKGSRIITIPIWAVPEEIRWNPEAIQATIDHQMKTWHAPAPLVSSSDLFLLSSLGTWTAETVSGGVATAVSPQTLTLNGHLAVTGSAPKGTDGKELAGIQPRMLVVPGDNDSRLILENLPAGYSLRIQKSFAGGFRSTDSLRPITANNYGLTIDHGNGLQTVTCTILGPDGAYVYDWNFQPGQVRTWEIPQIPSSVPAGTADLPLAVGINAGDAPVAVSLSPEGTTPLAGKALLMRPTAGNDVRLSFAPNGAGTAMIHELLTDLDARAGDGITYTVTVRKADGTSRQIAGSQINNGEQTGYIFQNETAIAIAKGDAIVLTLSSGADDRCDATAVKFDVAFLPESCTDLTDRPMGTVAGELNGLLGGSIIDRVKLFPEGQLNLGSSSDAIARAAMGAEYDGLSAGSRSNLRTGIEIAQGAVWTLYKEVVRQQYDWVLMKMNGVEMAPDNTPLNDGHSNSYLAQIPNLPSKETIRTILWEHRDEIYDTDYTRICKDSITLQKNAVLQEKQAIAQDQAVHDALSAEGLLSVQNLAPSSRSLSQQLALDRVFTLVAGAPDRAGWVVADFRRFDEMLAARGTETAALKTDSTTGTSGTISMTESKGTLQPMSFEWNVDVKENVGRGFTFSVDEPMLIDSKITAGPFQKAFVTLSTADGIILSQMTVGTGIEIPDQKSLIQTLPKGSYTLTVTGKTSSAFTLPIGGRLAPTKLSSVQGMVELGGKQTAVKLSVVAFDAQGRQIIKDPITGKDLAIEANKNTWLVIHGRTDMADSVKMKNLARSLASANPNDQIVTIDWSDAAKDNFTPVGLDGANWITKTGDWITNQLKALGITNGQNIRIVGHSWGSFVGYEVALNFGKVEAIVSLDSATDLPVINNYAASNVDFGKVSDNSWAFHSSLFGSDTRALTARYAIDMQDYQAIPMPQTIGGLAVELSQAYSFKHAGAVYLFSDLLKSNANGGSTPITKKFALDILLNGQGPNGTGNPGNYDGTLWVKYEERLIDGSNVLIPVIVDHNLNIQ